MLRVASISSAMSQAMGMIIMLAFLMLICADIFMRFFFNSPIRATIDLVEQGIVVLVFLNLPGALFHGNFIRSDGLINNLSKKNPELRNVLLRIFSVLGMIVFLCIAYPTWFKFVSAVERGSFVGSIGFFTFPTWPAIGAVFLGSLLVVFNYVTAIIYPHQELNATHHDL